MVHEAHLTLATSSGAPSALHALRGWLDAHALRLTHVELSRGASPHQTMVTGSLPGSTDDAIRHARSMSAGLAGLQIEISRIKLELPHSRPTAAGTALYLEHHVKVRSTPARLPELAALGAAQGAHVSRNPRRVLEGCEERFLTQRFSGRDPRAAQRGLEALMQALARASLPVIKVERECVVYDDNPGLDAGWQPEVSA